jgi:chemotaxis protein CheD
MSTIIQIKIAELFVGNSDHIIVANGVGSCIVIMLYDRLTRIGGAAHAILPTAVNFHETAKIFERDNEGKLFVKYADQAVNTLIEEIEMMGGSREHVVAKLVGGAHMFALLEGDQHGIGWKNTVAAREELQKLGITIETEVVGGTVGRNMRFDCSTGLVEIITKV